MDSLFADMGGGIQARRIARMHTNKMVFVIVCFVVNLSGELRGRYGMQSSLLYD